MIDWSAFVLVLVAALVGTVRRRQRLRARHPAPDRLRPHAHRHARRVHRRDHRHHARGDPQAAAKRAAKAARKSPLTDGQKRVALVGAWACFAISGVAVLYGIYLIVPALHGG